MKQLWRGVLIYLDCWMAVYEAPITYMERSIVLITILYQTSVHRSSQVEQERVHIYMKEVLGWHCASGQPQLLAKNHYL